MRTFENAWEESVPEKVDLGNSKKTVAEFFWNAALAERDEETCKWTEDEDGVWHTDCGNSFEFSAHGPEENGIKFCMYCGRKVTSYVRCVNCDNPYAKRDYCDNCGKKESRVKNGE